MADRNVIGIAFDLDVTDLKAGLNETKREINTANKEFVAATSGMDKWTASSEGLNAKLKQLDTVLKNQKKNVAGIEAELNRAEQKYGSNSEEVRKLKDQLLDAQAAVGKTERAQKKYNAELNKLESETKQATTVTGQLVKALKDTDNATVDLKGGFTVLKGALAGLVAQGIGAFVGGIKNAIDESKEFRRELGYLEQGAKDAGVSFDEAKDNVKEVTAITQDQGAAVEGLNNLMTAGFKGDALDKITDELVGASIKWKDTLKFEGLADGLQETLATGKGTGPFLEMLERAGISAETFNEKLGTLSAGAERQNFVMETLSGLGLADVKAGYEEANKSLIDGERAQFNYNETMAQVGERAEPILTTIKQGFADLLNSILDITEGVDFAALQESISTAFQYVIDEVVPKVKEFITFVLDNKDTILAAVVGLGTAFLAWKIAGIITTIIGVIKGWLAVTQGMTIAQRALNLVMSMNPIGLIITLIAGLIAAFVTLWNNSEEFRNFWIGLWDKIKAAVQPVIDFVKNAFTLLWDNIQKVWGAVVDWFKSIFDGIKNIFGGGNTEEAIGSPFDAAIKGIQNVWNTIVDWFKGIFENIKNIFGGGKTEKAVGGPFDLAIKGIKLIWDTAVKYFQMIFNNIKKIFSVIGALLSGDFKGAFDGIKGIWNNVSNYFKGVFENIKKVFSAIVSVLPNFFKRAWDGIKNIWNAVVNYYKNIFNGIKNIFAGIVSALIGFFRNAWNGIKNVWNAVIGYYKNIFNNIRNTFAGIVSALIGFFRNAWDGIKNVWNNVKSYFSSIIKNIINTFTSLPKQFITIGKNMILGLVDGVKSMATRLATAVMDTVKSAIDGVKSFLGIKSPSRLMAEIIGEPMGAGIGVGLTHSVGDVAKDVNKFTTDLNKELLSINSGLSINSPKVNGLSAGSNNNSSIVNNYTQIINAPKHPSRIELYRQTKNLLSLRGN